MDIQDMLRIGTVSSINSDAKTAKVIFRDLNNMVSGELPVLQHEGASVGVSSAGTEPHTHNAAVTTWMPKIGETVLCIYKPIPDGDGYILGVL